MMRTIYVSSSFFYEKIESLTNFFKENFKTVFINQNRTLMIPKLNFNQFFSKKPRYTNTSILLDSI